MLCFFDGSQTVNMSSNMLNSIILSLILNSSPVVDAGYNVNKNNVLEVGLPVDLSSDAREVHKEEKTGRKRGIRI